jgi:hypothetical protein
MAFVLAALLLAVTLTHPQPAWVDCNHADDVRPAGIVIACGDGNFWINRLTWKRWGHEAATAVGVGHINDCTPDCARGQFHTERISVHLSRVVTCGGRRPLFSRISWKWAVPKPAWRGRYENWNGSLRSPCTWLRPKP